MGLDQKPGQIQPGNIGQMEHDWSAAFSEMDLDHKEETKTKMQWVIGVDPKPN